MSRSVDIVYQDNWQGLYIDDKLTMCGHSLNLWEVLQELEDTVFFLNRRIEAYCWEKDLPENINDLVEDGKTKTIGELNA